jgi:hypothetical protein
MSRRLPLALPQFIQQAQEALTFSLSTLCGTPELSAIEKPGLLVQKLCTMQITCGRGRKKQGEICIRASG